MSVKLQVCFVFLCTVICIGGQYQNYPGNQAANYPAGYPNYNQRQNQTYPQGNYNDYPGVPSQIFPGPQPPFKQNQTGNTPSWQTVSIKILNKVLA